MKTYGYCRKKDKKNTTTDLKEAFADYACEKIFIDVSEEDKQLYKLLNSLQENDTLIVRDLLDFNMRMHSLVAITDKFKELNIHFISITNEIDTTKEKDQAFFYLLTELDYVERTIISKRLKHGLQKASEEGRVGGRPSIKSDLKEKILYLREQKKMSMRSIAEECDVSVGTVYKYSKQGD